jgi:hypothetical protein
LATEATSAGKTALATALTDFAGEITSDSATDDSFFQSFDSASISTSGKGTTWATILNSAAAVVRSKTLNNIAGEQSTIATQTTAIAVAEAVIATKTTTIADKQTVIADKQTAMETYQKRLKELGEGSGIRTISPSELVGLAKLYQVMIEQGKILDEGDTVSSAQQENAKEKYKQLTKKMETVIRELGPPDL